MRRSTLAGITALCAGALAVASGAAVQAAPPAPAAITAPAAVPATTTTTLPLFGVPLVVDITSGPGGALADVTINPADALTPTTVKPNRVRFVNTDGTAKVSIVSKHGGQDVSARAGQLSDLVGPGGWSGDLFGTGTPTNVAFTIGTTDDGSPDITGITSSDPTADIGDVSHVSRDSLQAAGVRIKFTSGTQARSLWILVSVKTWNGETRAKIDVGLSNLRGQKLPADQVVGPQTWTGQLCDGTAATINYTINADGSISDATATPTTADVKTDGRGLRVTFSDHERVRIRVKSHDDQMRVSVDEKIRCDSADPTVNGAVVPTTPDDQNADGDHGGKGGWGDHQGGDNSGKSFGDHSNRSGDDHRGDGSNDDNDGSSRKGG